jgi:hypothetical protein
MKSSEADTTHPSVDKCKSPAVESRVFNRKPGHYLPLMHYAAMVSSELYNISMLAPVLSEGKIEAVRLALCEGQWEGMDAIIGRNMSSYGYSAECIADTVSRARVQLPLLIKIYEHMIPPNIYTQVLPEALVTTHKYRERVACAITDRMPVSPPSTCMCHTPNDDDDDQNAEAPVQPTSRWDTASIMHFTIHQV